MIQTQDYSFLDETVALLRQSNENELKTIKIFEELLPDIVTVVESVKKKQKNESCDFNLFSIFSPTETTHSYIIANLLDPNAEHGQGKLFLYEFLKLSEVDQPELGCWNVTCEKGRIDICIERTNPPSVIIIENKSNGAEDQPNQLYRYWHKKIYTPYHTDKPHDDLPDFYKNNIHNFQIIYLVPNKTKAPDEQSLKRPSDREFANAPEKLPMPYKIQTFEELTTKWFSNLLDGDAITKNNHRIREYIKQYKEFWEP